MSSPGTGGTPESELAALARRSFRTYRARLMAAQRLGSRHEAWSSSLLAVTTGAVVASVALLVVPDIYGSLGSLLLAALSVLTLAVSLATTGLNYSARTRDMIVNYRKFQRISVEAENLLRLPANQVGVGAVEDLQSRYQSILDESENHSEADFELSRSPEETQKQDVVKRSRALTNLPYILLVFPIALIVPVVIAGIRGA